MSVTSACRLSSHGVRSVSLERRSHFFVDHRGELHGFGALLRNPESAAESTHKETVVNARRLKFYVRLVAPDH